LGCNSSDELFRENSLIGNWSCIDDNGNYTEFYIKEDTISLFSEDFYDFRGEMVYSIEEDTLRFNNYSYFIEYDSCSKIKIVNNSSELILERLPTVPENDTINLINTFYIRRCSFKVNHNLITMEEAIKYLNSLNGRRVYPITPQRIN
jgi:hypothetical protein